MTIGYFLHAHHQEAKGDPDSTFVLFNPYLIITGMSAINNCAEWHTSEVVCVFRQGRVYDWQKKGRALLCRRLWLKVGLMCFLFYTQILTGRRTNSPHGSGHQTTWKIYIQQYVLRHKASPFCTLSLCAALLSFYDAMLGHFRASQGRSLAPQTMFVDVPCSYSILWGYRIAWNQGVPVEIWYGA